MGPALAVSPLIRNGRDKPFRPLNSAGFGKDIFDLHS